MITYNEIEIDFLPISKRFFVSEAYDWPTTMAWLWRGPRTTPLSKTKEWGPLKKGARTQEDRMIVFPTTVL